MVAVVEEISVGGGDCSIPRYESRLVASIGCKVRGLSARVPIAHQLLANCSWRARPWRP